MLNNLSFINKKSFVYVSEKSNQFELIKLPTNLAKPFICIYYTVYIHILVLTPNDQSNVLAGTISWKYVKCKYKEKPNVVQPLNSNIVLWI